MKNIPLGVYIMVLICISLFLGSFTGRTLERVKIKNILLKLSYDEPQYRTAITVIRSRMDA